MTTHRSLENSIREIMAKQSQPSLQEESVEDAEMAEQESLSEAIDPSDTGGAEETDMATKQIKAMRHYLDGIEQRVKQQGDMEEWFQNKLTKANDYLKSLYGYGKGDDESVNEQIDEKMGDAFNRSMRATVRGGKTADYIQKKAKERSDLNKKNDPGMAKKGYALSVTDRDKAMKKAKKRGLNPKYPSQKYGKPNLPEEVVDEKTLTPAEKKKREEIAKAIERDNPKMPMDKKMAIATATAKKVAESSISDRTKRLIERAINRKT